MSDEPKPILGVAALLLTIYSWMLTVAIIVGRGLLGNGWPGALREYVSLGVTCCLTIFVSTMFRGQLRTLRQLRKKGRKVAISAGQAWVAVLIVLLAGIYGAWLFCGP